jgi:hypothetical protein
VDQSTTVEELGSGVNRNPSQAVVEFRPHGEIARGFRLLKSPFTPQGAVIKRDAEKRGFNQLVKPGAKTRESLEGKPVDPAHARFVAGKGCAVGQQLGRGGTCGPGAHNYHVALSREPHSLKEGR